jgi:hypothetical protein
MTWPTGVDTTFSLAPKDSANRCLSARSTTSALQSFDFENIKLIPILFQTGYLTLSGYDDLLRTYVLSFPNKEVKESYLNNLADSYT